jgi:site-specific DNA-methyltransferase (adenine-specific)
MKKPQEVFLNTDGLEFLETLPDNSVDLILTDPPYITSRDSGMEKWAHHVEKQDGEESAPSKSTSEWQQQFKKIHWLERQGEKSLKKRLKVYKDSKTNYLKYGSIYGKKYGVRTQYGEWDSDFTLEKLNSFIKHFYRVLRPGGTCIIFFDIWKITPLKAMLEESKFKQIRFIEWIKTNPQPINSRVNYLTNCREIALLGIKKSKPTFNSKYDTGIYRYPIASGKDRFHPTQKNLELFKELIKKHSNEGDIVLDTFAGSGTTLVAAKALGRQFAGCESDKSFYDKAYQRIFNQT